MEQGLLNWAPVPGYEGYYEVSPCAMVRSVDRVIKSGLLKRFVPGSDRSPVKMAGGYLCVRLHKDGIKKHCFLHRIVAEAHIPNPHNHPIVLHLDNDKSNCHASNLQWGTQSENVQHAWDSGTRTKYEKKKSIAKKIMKLRHGR